MVLLDNVVEVFNLAYKDLHSEAGVDRIHGRLVGTAFVHRDFVWMAIQSHGLVEEALRRNHVPLCRQQEVDGLAMLVDGAVEVFPDALDLYVRLIHAPVAADRALVFSGHLLDQRQKPNRPPVDRRMVDRNAALLHHFLEMPIAQRVGCIPPDANQDHSDQKAHPFEVEHVDSSGFGTAVYPTGPPRSLMRQNLQILEGGSGVKSAADLVEEWDGIGLESEVVFSKYDLLGLLPITSD
jgi:hypothetical protein